ncbi:MAG: hypothetical protein UU67_C0043G0002 [Candidatus Daviesbacteria bacterium GW2011_GWB1_41_5]|uniref:Uncharacterized protein n=1 Tax=Candidatus Daviesbacteria bacterium GW2011_GWB1_41_5 TaxID=1618429 RepID=A0A0G0ZIA7_9BACT|nr:MAG: hypothetical protein UU67_C0043G0002 [Candidatus Daviesbacteria bacterium GW2011_GWB1_41_5]
MRVSRNFNNAVILGTSPVSQYGVNSARTPESKKERRFWTSPSTSLRAVGGQ